MSIYSNFTGVATVASKKLPDTTVCIVGLGCVGLPLAQDFTKAYPVGTASHRNTVN
jgi:UDP-N-acetyl-D-mannosaminuronate dehydrogenase